MILPYHQIPQHELYRNGNGSHNFGIDDIDGSDGIDGIDGIDGSDGIGGIDGLIVVMVVMMVIEMMISFTYIRQCYLYPFHRD